MAEEKNIKTEAVKETEGKKYVVKLARPYKFEGNEYTEIDLSGIEKLTVQDAINAQMQLADEGEVACAYLCETTMAFARKIAAVASEMPIEFFKLMPRSASQRVMATVRSYFNVEEKTEKHVMKLENPVAYKGETVQEIDLSAVADLTSMNESEAENRLVRAGFMITNTSANYLYACLLASMATGKPEEFFTGLPLCETLKLKNAVNDPDFFA